MNKAIAKLAVSQVIQDDGSASTVVVLNDIGGLPIVSLTSWPSAVANPTETSSDQTPGPSAFAITPVAPVPYVPTGTNPAIPGGFLVATITCIQPVVQPPAQNVDFTVSIASGLVGQTAPISEDAGTLSIVGDPTAPGGFSVDTAVAA